MSPITLPLAATSQTAGAPDVATIGSGSSVPPGLEAVMEYRGVYLNVRHWVDTFVITEMDGLGDADVRDSREVNPQAHGETAFQSYYGGRTIALTGKIRAYGLEKLRDMQQGLRQAFSDIQTEYPLVFSAGNPVNDVMIYCKKSQPLAMREVQGNFDLTRDFLLTLRASNPRILSRYTSFGQWQGGTIEGFPTNATVTVTNLVENPSAETNTTGWLAGVEPTRDNTWAATGAGSWSFRVQNTVTNNDVSLIGSAFITVTPGEVLSLGAAWRIGANNTATGASGPRAGIQFDDGSGTWNLPSFYGSHSVWGAVGTTGRSTISNVTVPTGATRARIRLLGNTTGTQTVDLHWDAIICVKAAAVPDYSDGDTNSGSLHRWTGAPHASSSEKLSNTGLEANWVAETNATGASVRGGQLMQSNPQEFRAVRSGIGYKLIDGRITVKFATPATLASNAGVGVTFRKKDANNELMAQFIVTTPPSGNIIFYTRRTAGSYVNLASSGAYSLAANTSYWLRVSFSGAVLTGELFTTDPTVGSPSPVLTFSHTLTGADATDFATDGNGSRIAGDVGIRLVNLTDDYRVDDYRTEVLTTSGFQIFRAINNGNFNAQPQIQITGPITNPRLDFIDANSLQIFDSLIFKVGTVITSGSTWFLDIAKKTLVDQTGANKFSNLDINSDWPELLAGETIIQLSGTAMNRDTSATIMWRHTWM